MNNKICYRLLWTLAMGSLCGCHKQETLVQETPAARVNGQEISFPNGSQQLSSLSVQPAQPAVQPVTQLFGRLIWNDDVTVRVFTPFAGRVRRILVEPGARVEKGDPLVELESPDFAQAQSDVRHTGSDLELARRNLVRLRQLLEHGAAPQKDVDAAEAEAARAEAERSRAISRLAIYGMNADLVNGVFVLKSPVSGLVVEKNLTQGQEVRPDQMLANAPEYFAPMFVISNPERLWIQIDATEADLACLEPGREFTFNARAFPGQTFTGTVDHIADFIDPNTRSIKVRGTVMNTNRLLKAEMFVTVNLPSPVERGAMVPASAVYFKGEKHFVFVADDNLKFSRHEVQTGPERNGMVLVLSGVDPGQKVVTDGCVLLERMIE